MKVLLSASAVLAAMSLAPPALAQSRARIFDVQLGSAVSALPADEWVEPSCGTNGGPPSLRLASFADFGRCPTEANTGLHEVWFIYDDEWEFIARAYRDPGEIGRYSANKFYGQPIITSLLIDDGGRVQGYRVVTDPRALPEIRMNAYLIHTAFKELFRQAPWQCTSLPPDEREEPVDGVFFKEDCVMAADTVFARIEGRHLRKPGQGDFQLAPTGYFESSARLEVYNAAAVRDAPCCRASARP